MITYSALNYLKNCIHSQSLFTPAFVRLCSSQVQSATESIHCTESPSIQEKPKESKYLKVAIIGSPNSGKSTLINQIVERRVFPMSKKVHTTLCRARAVYNKGDTQLIFMDTPGLVSASESQKYKLSENFLSDGEDAINEADVIGVVHDLSNSYTRNKLDSKILRLLHLYQSKESFLVLNKVDTLKSKRSLLDLSGKLTGGKLRNYKEPPEAKKLSEKAVLEAIKKKPCWEHFSDIFMVSALLGKGTSDIRSYLLNSAHQGEWIFPHNVFTDQRPVQIIEETVRAKLLEYLPQEVPYNLGVKLEFLDGELSDKITTVVLISCKTAHIEKLVLGGRGSRIRLIAREAEQALIDTFMTDVFLRLVVTVKLPEDKKNV